MQHVSMQYSICILYVSSKTSTTKHKCYTYLVNILIAYASNSGSTYLTSKIIKETLENKSHKVDIKKAIDTDPTDLSNYEVVLLGSPSWEVNHKEGQPHETMLELMDKLRTTDLSKRDFALFGCGDSTYLTFCGAVTHLEDFVKEVNGTTVVPSLRIDSFYFELDKNTELIKQWAEQLSQKLPVSSLV